MRKPFNLFGRLIVEINLKPRPDWRSEALNLTSWQAWDHQRRKELGPFAGLAFFHRTSNRRSFNLVARHWPHRLCWDWLISMDLWAPKQGFPLKLSLIIDRPAQVATVDLLFVSFRFQRQTSEWMIASGPERQTAPRIIWAHQLRNTEPMGEA